jgi:predicted nuclease of predicted toxin-antitoxin system
MRFFLDNDVDAEVASFLTRRRHRCWRAGEAGLADANDELIAIYAEERQAVLISHDRAFARKRMANTTGQSVWLHCQQVDGVEVLAEHLAEVACSASAVGLVNPAAGASWGVVGPVLVAVAPFRRPATRLTKPALDSTWTAPAGISARSPARPR